MKTKQFFLLTLIVLTVILVSTFISAQNINPDINHYLNQDISIKEFNQLSKTTQTEILNQGSEEQRNSLLDKISADIRSKNKNYPSKLSWKGFDDKNLGFYGNQESSVIGDGKTFLPIDRIPKTVTEIEYVPGKYETQDVLIENPMNPTIEKREVWSPSKFILKNKEGGEIILTSESINENGDLKIFFENKNRIGNEVFSENLNDYEFSGNKDSAIYVRPDGFELGPNSQIKYNGFNFRALSKEESSFLGFNKEGLLVYNIEVDKTGSYSISSKGKEFKILFGDDMHEDEESFMPRIAISDKTVSEKLRISGNIKNLEVEMKLYRDVELMDIQVATVERLDSYGNSIKEEASFKFDVNPLKDSGMDFSIEEGHLKKLNPIGNFEVGVDEIRVIDSEGNYEDRVSAISKNEKGKYQLTTGNSVNVFTGALSPLTDSLVFNGGDLVIDNLGLPTDQYVKGIQESLNLLNKAEPGIQKAVKIASDINKVYASKSPDAEKLINEQLRLFHKDSSIPESVKSMLPESISITADYQTKMKLGLGVFAAGTMAETLRTSAQKDLTTALTDPFAFEIKLDQKGGVLEQTTNTNPEYFSDYMRTKDFTLSVGFRINELESINTIESMEKTISSLSDAKSTVVSDIKSSLLETQKTVVQNPLTKLLIQGGLNQPITIPESKTELSFLPTQITPEQTKYLASGYVTDSNKLVRDFLEQVSAGQNYFRVDYDGETKQIKRIYAEVNGKITELSTTEESKYFIKESILTLMNTPNLQEESADREWSLTENPLGIKNSPSTPNKVVERYCLSTGFKPGYCGLKTQADFENYKSSFLTNPYPEKALQRMEQEKNKDSKEMTLLEYMMRSGAY